MKLQLGENTQKHKPGNNKVALANKNTHKKRTKNLKPTKTDPRSHARATRTVDNHEVVNLSYH